MTVRALSLPPVVNVYPWTVLKRPVDRLSHLMDNFRGRPITRVRIALRETWAINDAELVRHVLQEHYKNYPKSDTYDALRMFLGNGLFTAEGDFWRRQRRLAQPAFHLKQLGALVGTMVTETQQLVDRWDARADRSGPFDIAAEMMRFTLTVVGRTLFDRDLSTEAGDLGSALTYVLKSTERQLSSIIRPPRSWPTPDNRRYARSLDILNAHVREIITARRNGARHDDLLQMLLDVRDEDTGEGMTDRQLRDEVMTLVLAGHETTANALSWAFYLLSLHPTVEQRVVAEVEDVLHGRPPAFADLPKLKYTLNVIQEAMRLYPPVWWFERQAAQDDVIGGVPIRAGTRIGIVSYALHRNPAYWANPEGFDPDRFEPAATAARPKFAYVPFGGGPRICIGNQFALFEAQIILAMVLQRFRVDLVPGSVVEPELMITLRPRTGVPVTLHRRAPRASASIGESPVVEPASTRAST